MTHSSPFERRCQRENYRIPKQGKTNPGSVFTNHSQEHSLSLSPRFANLNVTQLLIG